MSTSLGDGVSLVVTLGMGSLLGAVGVGLTVTMGLATTLSCIWRNDLAVICPSIGCSIHGYSNTFPRNNLPHNAKSSSAATAPFTTMMDDKCSEGLYDAFHL